MADEKPRNKCAHAQCSCPADEGSKYCSPACEAEENNKLLTIGCDCEHQRCDGRM